MSTFVVVKHQQVTVEADSDEEAKDLAAALPDSAWEDAWETEVESEND